MRSTLESLNGKIVNLCFASNVILILYGTYNSLAASNLICRRESGDQVGPDWKRLRQPPGCPTVPSAVGAGGCGPASPPPPPTSHHPRSYYSVIFVTYKRKEESPICFRISGIRLLRLAGFKWKLISGASPDSPVNKCTCTGIRQKIGNSRWIYFRISWIWL